MRGEVGHDPFIFSGPVGLTLRQGGKILLVEEIRCLITAPGGQVHEDRSCLEAGLGD